MNPIANHVREHGYEICWSSFNLKRLDAAIRFFETIPEERFCITCWQFGDISRTAKKHLNVCGTTACVGGWLAISPEWRKAGGKNTVGGLPVYGDLINDEVVKVCDDSYTSRDAGYSVAEYFGCSNAVDLFRDLMWVGDDSIYWPYSGDDFSVDVQLSHVIQAFKDIRRIVVAAKKKCGEKS